MQKRVSCIFRFHALSCIVLGFTLFIPAVTRAASVTLAWDPSPSVVDGYRVKYSANRSSPPYDHDLDAGSSLSMTVPSLLPGNSYAFAVTAYRDSLESGYSNQVGVSVSPQDVAFLDNDLDALPDDWEMTHFSSLSETSTGDFDGDGITNVNEYYQGSDPAGCPWTTSGATTSSACISSASSLQRCLTESESDGRHNTLMIREGYYRGSFTYFSDPDESYDLTVIGGYNENCSESRYALGATTFDALGNGTVLTLDTVSTTTPGNIWVEGVQLFNGVNPIRNGGGGCLAIYARGGRVDVHGNLLRFCDADEGGGIFVQNNTGTAVLSNNLIHDNTADLAAGLGVSTRTGNVTVLQNTIAGNTARIQGGGMGVWMSGNSGTTDVVNNIIWDNALTPNPAVDCGDDLYIESDADFDGTHAAFDVSYNLADFMSGVCFTDDTFTVGPGNITQDPLFVSPENDVFLLSGGSPAVDAGVASHPEQPAMDLEGGSRVVNGRPDLGADEYVASGRPVVLSPNGGGVFSSETEVNVNWTQVAGAASYRLSYSVDYGASWTTMTTVTGATSRAWTVPALSEDSDLCLIRVEALGSGGAVLGLDTSDRPFAIEAVPVRLLSPNGGEAVDSATVLNIRWRGASGATRYRLHYSQNGGATWYWIGQVDDATSVDWLVPILLDDTNRAMVRVRAYNASDTLLNEDVSDGYFSITTIRSDDAPQTSSSSSSSAGGGGGGGGSGAGTGLGVAGGGLVGALLLFFLL